MHTEDCILNELVLNFVGNKEIRKINKKYLKHDYLTDIITFPYNSNKKKIEGEVFISLETVKKNGEIYSTGYKMELKRVIIHGCLHLAGYNDKTNKEKELIRTKENFYLRN
jgi:rRNA maturation RNase YbeY